MRRSFSELGPVAYAVMYFTAPSEPGIHWLSLGLNTGVMAIFAVLACFVVRPRPGMDSQEVEKTVSD